jgi:LemA protein
MNVIVPLFVAIMAGGFALWLTQIHQMLVLAQKQVADDWNDLKGELMVRREMVPYIVAAVQVNSEQLGELLGNACDLAANVVGISECAQAEARLTAAIERLFAMLDSLPTASVNENLARLRKGLEDQEARIGLLIEAYNRRAETFNTLLRRGPARVFAYFAMFKVAGLFV